VPRRRVPLLLAASLALASCAARVPARSGAPASVADDEQAILAESRDLDRRIEESDLAHHDDALEDYLTGVARRLVATEDPGAAPSVRVRVLRIAEPNAFALPHGTVWVHVGMLACMDDEAQLATVLGHELAHVTHRHALRQARELASQEAWASVAQTVVGTLALLAYAQTGRVGPAASAAQQTKVLWLAAAVSGYSRDLEREADESGFRALRAAGYDARDGAVVFERLKEATGDADEGALFFATHPRLDERLASYRALAAAGSRPAPASGAGEADAAPRSGSASANAGAFRDAVAPVLLEDALLEMSGGRIDVARAAVARHLAWRSESARGYLVLGQVARASGRDPGHVGDALAAYKRAARLDPELAEPHREIGFLLREQGRDAEARAAFERYLALAPGAADAPLVRGLVSHP